MYFSNFITSSLLFAAAATAAQAQSTSQVKVHVVQVGQNSTLSFSPENLQVNPGEMVQFQFHAKNHSVVQSSFDSPCATINSVMSNVTGFKSGFMPVAANATKVPVFTMLVNDTKPIWVYCSQQSHCQNGMVMAINAANNGSKSFANFKALAMGQSNSTSSSSGSQASPSSGTGTTSSSNSDSSSAAAASSSSTAPKTVNAGVRPVVDTAILMALSVFGYAFIAL